MKLQQLPEKIKKPKRFQLVLHVSVDGIRLYMEKKVDAISKQDALMQVKHQLESANEKYVDTTDLNCLVKSIRKIGPSKSDRQARRLKTNALICVGIWFCAKLNSLISHAFTLKILLSRCYG